MEIHEDMQSSAMPSTSNVGFPLSEGVKVSPAAAEQTLSSVENLKGQQELSPQQKVIVNQKEQTRLDKALPDSPSPEAPAEEFHELLSENNLPQALVVCQAVAALRAENVKTDKVAKKEGEPSVPSEATKEGALLKSAAKEGGQESASVYNRFLAGSQYTALNEAITRFAQALTRMNIQEAKAARDMRKLELENVDQQKATIMAEGAAKEKLMYTQAVIKAIAGGLSAAAYGGGAMWGRGKTDVAVKIQTGVQTTQNVTGHISEMASKFVEASAQTELAGFEAQKVAQRDMKDNIQAQRQKAQEFINNNKEALTRLFDGLTEAIATQRRAMGIQRG